MPKVIAKASMEDRIILLKMIEDLLKKYGHFKFYHLRKKFPHMESCEKTRLPDANFTITKANLDNMFNVVAEVTRQLENGTYVPPIRRGNRAAAKRRANASVKLSEKNKQRQSVTILPDLNPNESIKDYVRKCLLSRPDDIEIVKLWLKVLSE